MRRYRYWRILVAFSVNLGLLYNIYLHPFEAIELGISSSGYGDIVHVTFLAFFEPNSDICLHKNQQQRMKLPN